jgi:DNA (cytosine-5)-methyltransferase 1
LVKRTIDAIKANENCKVWIWENVPQMLTALDGAVLNEILEDLGGDFEISYGVLNAADYGAPQLRKRAILIGSKIGRIELPEAELLPEEYMTVGDAFEGLDDSLPNQLDFSKPKADTLEKMKHVPPGCNWQALPDYLKNARMMEGKTHSSIYRRLEYGKPSISLPNVRKSNIMPPEGLRSLTIRECARLFGVMDSYIFKGKLSSMQQQICNAVCVPMARAIGDVVRKAIQQFNIRNGFEKLALV